jgi:hypothetical protein
MQIQAIAIGVLAGRSFPSVSELSRLRMIAMKVSAASPIPTPIYRGDDSEERRKATKVGATE